MIYAILNVIFCRVSLSRSNKFRYECNDGYHFKGDYLKPFYSCDERGWSTMSEEEGEVATTLGFEQIVCEQFSVCSESLLNIPNAALVYTG